jgi:hypothetical protein
MSCAPLLFKESDVTRAVKAVRKAGLDVTRVEISPDGKITVIVKSDNGEGKDRKVEATNPWDDAA